MLEFGNVMRASYGASVIMSAYAASDLSGEDTETQDIIEYLNDSEFTSYQTSTSGATEAISTVQETYDQVKAIEDDLEHVQAILEDLSEEGLTEEEQADLVEQSESYVEEIADVIEENPFLGPEGEDLAISIGNGSSITVQAQDLSISLEGVDLTTAQGIEAFRATLLAAVEKVSSEEEHLTEQLSRLENATQIIEYAAESELGVSSAGVDADQAMSIASRAASEAANNVSALFDLASNLDYDTVATLLNDTDS